MSPTAPIRVLAVTIDLPAPSLARLRALLPSIDIHHYPHPTTIPPPLLANIDALFTSNRGVAPETGVTNLAQMPRLRHIQLASAGADKAVRQQVMHPSRMHRDCGGDGDGRGRNAGGGGAEGPWGVTLASASGTHVLSIPPYVVAQATALWHQLPKMQSIQRNERRWGEREEIDQSGKSHYYARSLRGRTAGMLGYGALGRETARLLQANGMRILACNTSGKRTKQDGYIIPGTGDADASIPETFYSTRDPASLAAFLKETDLLVASLPNTRETSGLLDAEKLGWMKPESVFLNVGRGSLITSEELLKALDNPNLFGAAIDVTDPEPLPDYHALYAHPKCLVTPHTSGDTEGEMDIAVDILLENLKRMEAGEKLVNLVHIDKGY